MLISFLSSKISIDVSTVKETIQYLFGFDNIGNNKLLYY